MKDKQRVDHGLSLAVAFCMFISLSMLVVAVYLYEASQQVSTLLPWVLLLSGCLVIVLLYLIWTYRQKSVLDSVTMQQRLNLTEATLEATADGIVAFNHLGQIIYYNQNLLQMWPNINNEIAEMDIFEFQAALASHVENPDGFTVKMNECLHLSEHIFYEEIALLNGHCYQLISRAQILDQKIIGRVLSFHDISQSKNLEQSLLKRNIHDDLTDLPNRALLLDLLQFAQESVGSDQKVAVVLLNIDRLNMINDVFGSDKGNEVLQAVVQRLKLNVPEKSSLCRLGEDEFILIVNQLRHVNQLKSLINTFVEHLLKPVVVDNMEINIRCSIGVSVFPDHSLDSRELIHFADIAMMRAKKKGQNSLAFYDNKLSTYNLNQMQLENDLYKALQQQQFILVYQPIYHLYEQHIVGVEALIRWNHPVHGIVLPDTFIPIAEEIGLISDIGDWVVKESFHQLAQWIEMGLSDIKLAINVSAHHFNNNRLQTIIQRSLASNHLNPDQIEIELTERMLMESNPMIGSTLKNMSDLGMTVSLDDFGTGYSSLGFLKQFPINKIKMDQSFISNMHESDDNKNLVKAMISMAQSLNIDILAEGVEKKEQLYFLQIHGCVYGQGYYLAHPMDPIDCFHFIRHKQQQQHNVLARKDA